jgi:hypothetical protein
MKRWAGLMLGPALLLTASAAAGAAGVPIMPMSPGFAERLQCGRGSVAVDVTRADPRIAPRAVVVTTTIAIGSVATKTRSVRTVDGQGNIYSLGYVAGDALKAFPKRLLLPASPPAAGARSSYYNVSGIVIAKRFEGAKAALDAHGRPLTGYVFSDYLSGRKLNAVTYVPSIGIAEARFFGMLPDGSDLTCRLG